MNKMLLGRRNFLVLSLVCLLFSPLLWGQKIDPFYLKLLKDGENSYVAQNYKEAIKELEVAAFGLYQQKTLAGKAYVYLSLCYGRLNNKEMSEQYLKNALALLGKDGLGSLEIHESAIADLERQIRYFKLDISLRQQEPEESLKKEIPKDQVVITFEDRSRQKKPEVKIQRISIQELEKGIREEPRRAEFYYALAQLYQQIGNIKAAKNTLRLLVENNPAEIRGYLEQGKMAYQEKNYREADKKFETYLQFARNLSVEEKVLEEATLYLILNSYLRGDIKKLKKLLRESQEIFSSHRISDFPFTPQDKERLQTIWNTYGIK